MQSEPRNARISVWALPRSLAATCRIDVSFSSSGYLDVSVHRVPLHTLWIHVWIHEVCSCGFPHSDISGSMRICRSPKLFAAYHVFHRLSVPRHPPCALLRLTKRLILDQVVHSFRLAYRILCTSYPHPPFGFRLILDKSYPFWIFRCLISVFGFQGTYIQLYRLNLGTSGLEPPTSRLSGVRSNRLSYAPLNPAATYFPISSPT